MKAFNICSGCGVKIETVVLEAWQKRLLEINNPVATCEECDKSSHWKRVE